VSPLNKRRADSAPKAEWPNISPWHFLCPLLFLFATSSVWAVDPHTLISQYGHTAWRTQDGFFNTPSAFTQTTDGYIWIATSSDLVRFDGVKFSPWTAPKGKSLPYINYLLGARDGTLWLGTTEGLLHLKDGELFSYVNKPRSPGISAIMEDHTGTIWVTRYRVNDGMGPLCRVTGATLQCYGKKDGIPGEYAMGLVEDSAGNIWFGCQMLCRWAPGSSSVYFEEQLKNVAGDGVVGVAAGTSGSIWASLDGIGPKLGVQYYSHGKWSSYVVPGFDGSAARSHTLFVDRNQTLWVGTESKGLYHIHDGFADHYGSANGLSSNLVGAVYEDKEGNLWVATDRGIDLFRDIPIATFSGNEGLVGASVRSILALSDGSVWAGNDEALDIIHKGGISAIAAGHGLPGQNVQAMFQDRAGRIWVGIDETVTTYERGRFVEIKKLDGGLARHVGTAYAFAEDVEGNIWVLVYVGAVNQVRLLRIKGKRIEENIPVDNVFHGAQFIAADRDPGIWVLSLDGKLDRYRNGKAETVVSLGSAERAVTTHSLSVDSDNAVWAATSKGLYRWKDSHLNVMDSRNGLPCSSIYSMIKDDYGSFWLYTKCGLLRIPTSEWATWLKFPEGRVSVKIYDALDGAQPDAATPYQPIVSKSPDGRLWFASNSLVQMIDPGRIYANVNPPPVHIEELAADHKSYDVPGKVSLPPLRSELQISYTALSFTVPRRVFFRYRLEGHDEDWQEAGTRRQAFYNDLRPGEYRFRVIACNNDGVWNEEGATLDFSIAPAWYQTNWFRALCFISAGLMVCVIYRLRIRQISRAIGARFDERLAERTRMARDLHDTFLQTVQGSKLVADEALEPSTDPIRMRRAMEQLSVWLGRATQEGRAALNSLRTATTQTNDLAEALRRVAEDNAIPSAMSVTFSVFGDARETHPIVRDEIYRIGYEAIRNASTHSGAGRLEVELKYDNDLVLLVSDNGTGIDPAVADTGKDGHFGLQGMRERAARIGGRLTLVSSSNSGTEIRLIVPGAIIFRKTMPARRSLFTKMTNLFR
jgi:ligand-binding sensor domain-containing protein